MVTRLKTSATPSGQMSGLAWAVCIGMPQPGAPAHIAEDVSQVPAANHAVHDSLEPRDPKHWIRFNAPRAWAHAIPCEPSYQARIATRMLRWMTRSPPAALFELHSLLRLRRRIALVDRLSALFGIGRTEKFLWHRAPLNGVRTRMIRPRLTQPAPEEGSVLLYLHGGAFTVRALNRHMNLASAICRAGGLAESGLPLYRLAPECPFPAAVDDCLAAYCGFLQRGIAAQRIVLAGDSAGGGLVLKLLMRLRAQGLPMPACGVLLSPFTDMSCSGESIARNACVDPMFGSLPVMHARFYLGTADAKSALCSPVFGDFSGLPPLLVQVGSTERLLDDSLRLVPRVQRAGGELEVEVWEQMPHVWQTMGLPESERAIASIGQFVRKQLTRSRIREESDPDARGYPDVYLPATSASSAARISTSLSV